MYHHRYYTGMIQTPSRTLNIKEAAETRRSIRTFVQEPIDQRDLKEILRLTSLAPSAWNVQPWRFAVVQNNDLKAKLQAAAFNQKQVSNAPAVLVLYSDMEDVLTFTEEVIHPNVGQEQIKTRAESLRKNFEQQPLEQRAQWANTQTNIALGYLLLIARGFGYDTVPMLGFDPDKVKELLGLPTHVQIAALVPIGKRAEEGHAHHRHNLDRIATFY